MLTICSVISILVIISIIVYRTNRDIFSVFDVTSIVLFFSLLDFYFPLLLWSIYGKPNYPGFDFNDDIYLISLLYYSIFYAIMLFPLMLHNNRINIRNTSHFIRKKRLYWISILLLILVALNFYREVSYLGGLNNWILEKTYSRYDGGQGIVNRENSFVNNLPLRETLNVIMLIGLYNRNKFTGLKKSYFAIILPLTCLVLSFITFFRGSIMMLIVGIIFCEFLRNFKTIQINRTRFKRKIIKISTLIILIFTFSTYGRGYLIAKFQNIEYSNSIEESILFSGHGLHGISNIIFFYSKDHNLLQGKTYFDMILMPIPRAIYRSKPKWYGIDDITRKMGWPKSTQSAVTIPGEAFANFGYLGILMSLFWATILFVINRITYSINGMIWLLPGCIFYMISISNWMAFTGFMNKVLLFILIALTIKYLTINVQDNRHLVKN